MPTISLRPNRLLTLTTDAFSSGHIVELGSDKKPVAGTFTTVGTSATVTVGPNTAQKEYRIQEDFGSITQTETDAIAAPNAIASNTVEVGDLDVGTDGELLTWDASGNPTTVAVGTSGHVLTSNGAGAAPTFQAAAGGGGAWELISTSTPTGTDEVAFTGLSSSYLLYKIVITNVEASDADQIRMQFSTDNGSTYISTSTYLGATIGFADDAGNGDSAITGLGYVILHTGNAGTTSPENFNAEVTLYNPSQTNGAHMYDFRASHVDAAGDYTLTVGAGGNSTTSAVDAVKIYSGAAVNFTNGTIALYGLSAS